MKAILISIKSKYVAKILNGDKTIEIRKTMPKCDLPIDVYIYATKDSELDLVDYRGCDMYGDFRLLRHNGKLTTDDKQPRLNGKVVAKFRLNDIEPIYIQDRFHNRSDEHDWGLATKTLNENELCEKSCVEIEDIWDYLTNGNGYAWHIDNLVIFDKPKELSEFYPYCKDEKCEYRNNRCSICYRTPLTKAPQSWRYIEVIENERK